MNSTSHSRKLAANVLVWVLFASTFILSVSSYLSFSVQHTVKTISDTQVSTQLYEDTLSLAEELIIKNKLGEDVSSQTSDKVIAGKYLDYVAFDLDVGQREEYRFTFRENEAVKKIDDLDTAQLLNGIGIIWNDSDKSQTGDLQVVLGKWGRSPIDDTSRVKTFWNNLSKDLYPLGACDDRFPLRSGDPALTSKFSTFDNCFPLVDEDDTDMNAALENYLLILKSLTQPISIRLQGYMKVVCADDEAMISDTCTPIDDPGVSCTLPEVSVGGVCSTPEDRYIYIDLPDKYLQVSVEKTEARPGSDLTRDYFQKDLIYENGTYPSFPYSENKIEF